MMLSGKSDIMMEDMIIDLEDLQTGALPLNKIIHGHVLETLRRLPSESIDLIIFSPPYYGLRNYTEAANVVWDGDKECDHEWVKYDTKGKPQKSSLCIKCGAWYGQLGLEPTPQMYIDHMIEIFKELKRVLKKTGSIYINISDTYSTALGKHGNRTAGFSEKNMVTDEYKPPRPKNIPPKSLIGIPWRLALRCIDELGLILRNDIIWYKPNHMPSSVKDRLTVSYEHMFHFVKSRKYYYNLDNIRVPHTSKRDVKRLMKHGGLGVRLEFNKKWSGKNTQKAFLSMHPNGKNPGDVITARVKANLEHFMERGGGGHYAYGGLDSPDGKHFHRLGKNPGDILYTKHDIAVNRIGNFSYTDPLHIKEYHPYGKNPGDFWSITTRPFKEAHFAVYPPDIVLRPILSSCPPDGIVLDPFLGSGTTAVAVEYINHAMWGKFKLYINDIVKGRKWNIKWIGIEVVLDYCRIAERRIRAEIPSYQYKTLETYDRG